MKFEVTILFLGYFLLTVSPSTLFGQNDKAAQLGKTGIKNAGKAKMPSGTLTFKIDGKSYSATTQSVQCMFIGLGSPDYAQGMISASGKGFTISCVMMGPPKVGTLKSKKVASMVGMNLTLNGITYDTNGLNGMVVNVEKIKQDGNNYYTEGTFSATVKSKSGDIKQITNAIFSSTYVK
jgi:hypothetical protein